VQLRHGASHREHRIACPPGLPTHTPRTIMAAPPSLPPMGSTDSFNPDFNASSVLHEAGDNTAETVPAPASPVDTVPAAPVAHAQEHRQDAHDPQLQQKVHDVLHSDIGVNTLLNRLKASIASARVRAAAQPARL
jgi:hypothetical protein